MSCCCCEKMLVVGNAQVVTLGSEEVKIIPDGAIVVKGDTIVKVGTTKECIECAGKDADYVDAQNRLLMPGFICAHGHYYGAFCRGLDLKDTPASNFVETLERLWWRLDRALDKESTRLGAMMYAVGGLKAGCTTVIDHHSSPYHTLGSLDDIAEATKRCGVRACLCYEVTDRNGQDLCDKGIEENVRFARRVAEKPDPMLTAAFGMHASFTMCDETMKKCTDAVDKLRADFPKIPMGYHIHVAEDMADEKSCAETHKDTPTVVARLEKHKVLGPDTVVGHGVHLNDAEIATLVATKTPLVTNLQSNMNNAVGVPRLLKMMADGVVVGMGTDGMTYDMLMEYRASALIIKHSMADPRVGTMDAFNMLFRNNSIIASRHFAKPVGRLEAGAFADFLLVDYDYPTQLGAGGLPWHLHFGSPAVKDVYVAGEMVVKDGKIITVDEAGVYARCRMATPDVWARMWDIVEKDKAAKK